MKQSLKRTGLWMDSYINSTEIIPILTQEDFRNDFDKVYKCLSLYDGMSDALRNEFHDLTIAPWLLFITRNLSVEKAALEEIRPFDERFFSEWLPMSSLIRKLVTIRNTLMSIGYLSSP
jgi:hypothetical protein